MSDNAKNSHIERTFYVGSNVTPGSSITWGTWESNPHAATRCRECNGSGKVSDRSWCDVRCTDCGGSGRVKALPLTVIELASGSDYSGSLVEVSNFQVLQQAYPWLVEIRGGYGTFGLAYLGARENQNPALIESIAALSDYPLLDENHHSNLEREKVDEAWESDGRDDFKRALTKYFDAQYAPDEHDLDAISNERIDQLWWDCTERLQGGEDHINEQGDSIYFPISQVIKKIERCYPGLDRPHYSGERPSINVQLASIASDATPERPEDPATQSE